MNQKILWFVYLFNLYVPSTTRDEEDVTFEYKYVKKSAKIKATGKKIILALTKFLFHTFIHFSTGLIVKNILLWFEFWMNDAFPIWWILYENMLFIYWTGKDCWFWWILLNSLFWWVSKLKKLNEFGEFSNPRVSWWVSKLEKFIIFGEFP